MVWPTSSSWSAALLASHEVVNRVQVWPADGGKQIGSLAFTDGSVTDVWQSGARRSLSLSFAPSAEARLMVRPGNELRVFSGIGYGHGQPELLPMGRFPVTETQFGWKPDAVSVNCSDRWQWVVRYDFPVPTATSPGITVQLQIARFLVGTGRWRLTDITQAASSAVKVSAQVFDTSQGGRAQACIDLATSIGAEVFIDRLGNPVIRDRQATGPSRAAFVKGVRLRDGSESLSDTDVFNSVRVVSSSTDPAFKPPNFVASIVDHAHPAYPRNGIYRTFQYESPQLTTVPQMKAAAEKLLTKVSRRARELSVTATIPDPSLDASDTITVTPPETNVAENGQAQQVTHPLRADGLQVIGTVSTRSDEDFTP